MKLVSKIIPFFALIMLILPMSTSLPVYHEFRDVTDPTIPAQEENQSIIIMIGDGMGFEHVNLARLVEVGESGTLTMDKFPMNASVTTFSADEAITDSAAAATAIATGEKTNNTMISIDPNGTRLETILEIAQGLGKATGAVSTSSIVHATPAAFMTHVEHRNSYNTIATQIAEEANVDVLLGGGAGYFWTSHRNTMESNGYVIVENRTDLAVVNSGKVLGLFSPDHLDFEQYRDYNETPSLAEMTTKSIELLSQDSDGFFLIVEGGRIDHGAHASNEINTALDAIAFDQAVRVALDYVESHDNTILIVTADHETGGLMITGNNLNNELPSTENSETENRDLRIERASNVTVTWGTTGHTDSNVPLFMYGEELQSYSDIDVFDNTDLFDIMSSYFITPSHTTTNSTTIPDISVMTLIFSVMLVIGIVVLVVVLFIKRK